MPFPILFGTTVTTVLHYRAGCDLIQNLRKSGYVHIGPIGRLFIGAIAYADDILSFIVFLYWITEVRFNPSKSQVMTIGGSAPVNMTMSLSNKVVQWVSKVKYLGLYLTTGPKLRIDLTVAKRKYYGCFNTIKSKAQQTNEIMWLHLIKTHCLPRLLYGCEVWPLASINMHGINVLWNNGYRHVFNCCWYESVKPLQYYSNNLPLSYLIEERQLLFYKKLSCNNNSILRALMSLPAVYYELLALASKCHHVLRGHGRRSHRSWGHDPPLLEAKGTGGHNLGIIHFTYCSYHAFTLMSTQCQQYFVPPLAKKRGSPTFKTVAPPLCAVASALC